MLAKIQKEKADKEEEKNKYSYSPQDAGKKTRIKAKRPDYYRKPVDIRADAKYEGGTAILLDLVPNCCIDEETKVEEVTIREYIVFAIIEEDPFVHKFNKKIAGIIAKIDEINKRISGIPQMLLFAADMKTLLGPEEARVERGMIYEAYGDERLVAEKDLGFIRMNLRAHILWRRRMGVDLTKGPTDKNTDTAVWYLTLYGTNDALDLENILLKKKDWPTIKLAAAALDEYNRPIPPFAGRGDLPNGKKPDQPDMRNFEVNMAGVHISRSAHGVGLVKQLDRRTSNIYAEQFGLFYGEFELGKKEGLGLEINDNYLYSGMYESGFKRGKGRMEIADGTCIVGDFGLTVASELPQSREFQNPYLEGEPNGMVEIHFGDGGYYKGQIKNGRISGRGDYQSAFNEVLSGNFQDGVLHGDKNFYQTYSGETYFGLFKTGEVHGKAMYMNQLGDSFNGSFRHGLRHGRGLAYVNNGGRYRGYYVNDIMHGKGSIEYGVRQKKYMAMLRREMEKDLEKEKKLRAQRKVAEAQARADNGEEEDASVRTMEEEKEKKIEAEEAAKAEAEMKKKAGFDENAVVENDFDSVFRGFVFGNQPFNLGYDMKFQTMVPKVLPRNGILRIHNINKFLRKETKSLLGHNRINEKLNDMEVHVRAETEKKKTKIFYQQRHHTKKSMYEQDQGDFSSGGMKGSIAALASKMELRLGRLDNVAPESLPKKALVPRLRMMNTKPANDLIRMFKAIQPEKKDVPEHARVFDKLVEIAASDFDEVNERQRFLKYDNMWSRAELAFAAKKKSKFS